MNQRLQASTLARSPSVETSVWEQEPTSKFGARTKLGVTIDERGHVVVNLISQSALQRLGSALVDFFSRGQYKEYFKTEKTLKEYDIKPESKSKFLKQIKNIFIVALALKDISKRIASTVIEIHNEDSTLKPLVDNTRNVAKEVLQPPLTVHHVATVAANTLIQKQPDASETPQELPKEVETQQAVLEPTTEAPQVEKTADKTPVPKATQSKEIITLESFQNAITKEKHRLIDLKRNHPLIFMDECLQTLGYLAQIAQEETNKTKKNVIPASLIQALEKVEQQITEKSEIGNLSVDDLLKKGHYALAALKTAEKNPQTSKAKSKLLAFAELGSRVPPDRKRVQEALKACDLTMNDVNDPKKTLSREAVNTLIRSLDPHSATPHDQMTLLLYLFGDEAIKMPAYRDLGVLVLTDAKKQLYQQRYLLEKQISDLEKEIDHTDSEFQKDLINSLTQKLKLSLTRVKKDKAYIDKLSLQNNALSPEVVKGTLNDILGHLQQIPAQINLSQKAIKEPNTAFKYMLGINAKRLFDLKRNNPLVYIDGIGKELAFLDKAAEGLSNLIERPGEKFAKEALMPNLLKQLEKLHREISEKLEIPKLSPDNLKQRGLYALAIFKTTKKQVQTKKLVDKLTAFAELASPIPNDEARLDKHLKGAGLNLKDIKDRELAMSPEVINILIRALDPHSATPHDQLMLLLYLFEDKAQELPEYEKLCELFLDDTEKQLHQKENDLENAIAEIDKEIIGKDITEDQKGLMRMLKEDLIKMMDKVEKETAYIKRLKHSGDPLPLESIGLGSLSDLSVFLNDIPKMIEKIKELASYSKSLDPYLAFINYSFSSIPAIKEDSTFAQQLHEILEALMNNARILVGKYKNATTPAGKDKAHQKIDFAKQKDAALIKFLNNLSPAQRNSIDLRLRKSVDQLQKAYEALPGVDKSIEIDEHPQWEELSDNLVERLHKNTPPLTPEERAAYVKFANAYHITVFLFYSAADVLGGQLKEANMEVQPKLPKDKNAFINVIFEKVAQLGQPFERTFVGIGQMEEIIPVIQRACKNISNASDRLITFEEEYRYLESLIAKKPSAPISKEIRKVLDENDIRKKITLETFRDDSFDQVLEDCHQGLREVAQKYINS